RRPHISTDKPKKWNRPIAEGVLPAYDEALKIIIRDSEDLTKEAKELGKKIDALETEAEEAKDNTEKFHEILKELEALRERYHILSVQSQINMPSVRWTVANAQLDPWSPAHLHLAEQRWRGEGGLDILMERLHQMHVVPDLLPGIHPSLDLHVTVPYPLNKQFKRSMKSGGKSIVGVEPGSFLSPTQTARAPGLWAHAWHSDVRLYTMVMLDPDVPDEETRSFTTYVHWMKPNIPVSAVAEPRAFISPALLNSHTTYVPPHPQQGTPYHRYTILLLPQPPKTIYSRNLQILLKQSTTTHADLSISSPTSWPLPLLKKYTTSQWLDIPIVSDSQRRGFNLRKFVREWGTQVNGGKGLDSEKNHAIVVGGGVHMFREVWDETVSGVFKTSVAKGGKIEEKYTLPKKVDRYEGLKGVRKYI
ncbi:phosphatidylethanolamine-binding protein, partial [Lentinula aff. detonsa]